MFLVFQQLGVGGDETPTGDLVAIENVAGLSETDALTRIQSQDLVAIPSRENSETVSEGFVIRTEPVAGTEVEPGSTVTVFVSAGIEQFPVPSLVGLDQATAIDLIERQGFVVGIVTPDPDSSAQPGTVTAQDPLGNVQAPAGATVDITVAAGPDTVELTELVGLTEREANAALQSLGPAGRGRHGVFRRGGSGPGDSNHTHRRQ